MPARRGRLIGVGVDLVEVKRVERLVRRHPDGVARFLTPAEAVLLKNSRKKALAFALIFAAKEAASKSVGVSLAGPGMLRDFRVLKRGRRLEVRWSRSKSQSVQISLMPFFFQKNLVGMLAASYSTRPARLVK